MYNIIKNFLSYTGTQYTNIDQYIIYGAITIGILMLVFFCDILYRIIRSFIKK